MDLIAKGWFTEVCPESPSRDEPKKKECKKSDDSTTLHDGDVCVNGWKGQAFSLKIAQILYHERSPYQDILLFKSESYGTVLVLDGIIQCTERDEFSYQEMLAHLPMCLFPSAKKVLIIGGGDGGILREVLKHSNVESVVLCEIDEKVIDACKKFLSSMSACFSDPKVTVHVGDGLEFMKRNKNCFDVIITDSSDPIGPAEMLFTDSYYALINEALTENGVLASQAESIWLHLDLIKNMMTFCKEIFPVVGYAYSSVPSYPSGVIGYLICSKNKTCDLTEPDVTACKKLAATKSLRYYNGDVHKASFVLPQFANEPLTF